MIHREFKRRVHRAAELILIGKATFICNALRRVGLPNGPVYYMIGRDDFNWTIMDKNAQERRNHRALLLAWYAEVGPELLTEEG